MKKILLSIILGSSLIGCSSLNKLPNQDFLGKSYTLASSSKDYKISLEFAEDNFFGYSGVNNYFGRYHVKGNNLRFDAIGSTMMSGPTKAMNAEIDYLDNLSKVDSFNIKNNNLILHTVQGKKLLFNEIK